jgi:tetratricopeptide (TPR) repeat protein
VNKGLWLSAGASLLLVSGFALAAQQDWKSDTSFASPGRSLKSARESLAAGYYAGAVADLATLVMRVPADAEVHFLLGAAHWGNGNKEEAQAALKTALTLDPQLAARLDEYPVGPGAMGRIGHPGGASPGQAPRSTAAATQRVAGPASEDWMKDTSFLTPGHAYAKGLEELQAGNPASAANWFRDVVGSKPESAIAWFQLGAATRAAGQEGEALTAFEKALELDRSLASRIDALPRAPAPRRASTSPPIGSAAYLLNYARHHLNSGDGPAAANYARQALKAEPGNREARQLLNRALVAGPAKAKTCQQQWSSCWVTAREFSDRNMCTQRRLACEANAR